MEHKEILSPGDLQMILTILSKRGFIPGMRELIPTPELFLEILDEINSALNHEYAELEGGREA